MDLQKFRITFLPEKVPRPRRRVDDLYGKMGKCPTQCFFTAPFLFEVKLVKFHVSGPARSHGTSQVSPQTGKGL